MYLYSLELIAHNSPLSSSSASGPKLHLIGPSPAGGNLSDQLSLLLRSWVHPGPAV